MDACALAVLTACGCAITYALTPFTGSSVGTQLNAEMRFLLPAVALATVTLAAALPGYWCRLGAVAALAANAVFLAVVESRDGFLGLPIPLVAAAGVAGVAAALRWRGALTRAARAPTVRRAAVLALAVLSVLATAHLQPPSAGTPLARALQGAGNPGGPVVVMDVGDVAVLLGPRLDVDVVAAGEGPVGAERPRAVPASSAGGSRLSIPPRWWSARGWRSTWCRAVGLLLLAPAGERGRRDRARALTAGNRGRGGAPRMLRSCMEQRVLGRTGISVSELCLGP